jgi:twitching motility protein PilT
MANLDRYLEAMKKHNASALILRAGNPVVMVMAGSERPVSSQGVAERQIQNMLTEVLGASYVPGLSGTRTFPYDSPIGPVAITVDERTGLDVKIEAGRPSAPAPQSLELSPMDFGALPEPVTPAPVMVSPPRRAAPVALQMASADMPLEIPDFGSADDFQDSPPPPEPPARARPAVKVQPVANRNTSGMDALFHLMLDARASDLHLKSNTQPMLRVDGGMGYLQGRKPMSSAELTPLLESIMPERNRLEFAETNDTDFAYELTGRARMRCNVFRDLAGIGAVFRQIPTKILTAEDLGLPPAVIEMCGHSKGLVVVTGPTGSGKSTTLAGMIDWINKNRNDHIITIEDPVEFVHKDQKCLVNQREVGVHTKGFKSALRAALREDPDIVLVGEMRDLETVAIAIETAETGHLVFGTLHTNTAPSTVDRLIDQFASDRQPQIRLMLSESLRGVVAQTLLKRKGGGRVAALEILIVTPAIANLIREGKTYQIPSIMQTGRGLGMQTLSDSIMQLVMKGTVEAAEAYAKSPQKKEMAGLLTRAGFKGPWSAAAGEA